MVKPSVFKWDFLLITNTMNSTSHMPYLHNKLFPTVLCQYKFKCIHQKSVAWNRRLCIKIKSQKWKYNTVFNLAHYDTHSLKYILIMCPAKHHGGTVRHIPHWSGIITLSTLSPCRKTWDFMGWNVSRAFEENQLNPLGIKMTFLTMTSVNCLLHLGKPDKLIHKLRIVV